jgi:hypothetical protein
LFWIEFRKGSIGGRGTLSPPRISELKVLPARARDFLVKQATLFVGEEEVLQVSLVVQVTPDAAGQLYRSIYNPLE